MPVLGIGTAVDPPVAPEVTKKAILQAIELGYRHFDTAAVYGSESHLGPSPTSPTSCPAQAFSSIEILLTDVTSPCENHDQHLQK
ncbi:hypothetical protein COLO4_36651 [Corchorus olitorius]|uniref:Aldo/keto reductase n=1 Tax=Corchorus olitorius TaxID=93759 RepID=A0A1R3G700_9ROSI|nr:hypothetical protein COLO4_36651 [Corchorus olitorius]